MKPQVDPFDDWIDKNQKILEQYKGKVVAIHPEMGVMASGTFEEVYSKVVELDLIDEVVIMDNPEIPFIGGFGPADLEFPEDP